MNNEDKPERRSTVSSSSTDVPPSPQIRVKVIASPSLEPLFVAAMDAIRSQIRHGRLYTMVLRFLVGKAAYSAYYDVWFGLDPQEQLARNHTVLLRHDQDSSSLGWSQSHPLDFWGTSTAVLLEVTVDNNDQLVTTASTQPLPVNSVAALLQLMHAKLQSRARLTMLNVVEEESVCDNLKVPMTVRWSDPQEACRTLAGLTVSTTHLIDEASEAGAFYGIFGLCESTSNLDIVIPAILQAATVGTYKQLR